MKFRLKVLAVAVASGWTGNQVAHSATITVNSASDLFVLAGSSVCNLRGAISAANSDSAVAGCAAGSGVEADVIEFDPLVFGETISLVNGQLTIASSMTIDASAAGRRRIGISGNNSSRVFNISNGHVSDVIDVTLYGLDLTQGFVSADAGGAIRNDHENVELIDCTITGNVADDLIDEGNGGGIANFGTMTLTDSTISDNTASNYGGAIINYGASLSLYNTTVSGNGASRGGGIQSQDGPGGNPSELLIRGGAISGNSATIFGGGISAMYEVTLSSTSVSGNTASNGGGVGMFSPFGNLLISDTNLNNNYASGSGGALRGPSSGLLNITNSQLYNNSAGNNAGAIYSLGVTTITDSTVIGNTAISGTGGGIRHLDGYNLSIDNSQISMNGSASSGAGIYASGPVSLIDSSVSGNAAQSVGGGVYAGSGLTITRSTFEANTATNGAAFYTANTSTALLTNVTVSENLSTGAVAMPYSAAIYAAGIVRLSHGTLVGNAPSAIAKPAGSGSWSMFNTVLVDSAITDCVDAVKDVDLNINNFIGDGSCATDAINLLVGDPMLQPLADIGGLTRSHGPSSGSALVDAGDSDTNYCPSSDQTAMPRPIDGDSDGDSDCDIGSVEFVDLFPPLANLISAPDISVAGASSIEIQVSYTDLDGAVDFASVGSTDLTINPGPLVVQSVALGGTVSQLIATYTVLAPGGSWDADDNATYNIVLSPNEVLDIASTGVNGVPGGSLGGFTVAIAEIDVSGGGISIADGDQSPSPADNTDFGDVALQNVRTRTFIIANSGAATINLDGPLLISGSGFSVTQPPVSVLAAGETTQFQVSFSPTVLGPALGQVTINSNDSDENPYSFALAGNGVEAGEDIFADGFESP